MDRINVNGDYEPSNCRWVEPRLQPRNKRCTVYLTAFGETKPLPEWLETYAVGMSEFTIRSRIKRGWDGEKTLLTPPRMGKSKYEQKPKTIGRTGDDGYQT